MEHVYRNALIITTQIVALDSVRCVLTDARVALQVDLVHAPSVNLPAMLLIISYKQQVPFAVLVVLQDSTKILPV